MAHFHDGCADHFNDQLLFNFGAQFLAQYGGNGHLDLACGQADPQNLSKQGWLALEDDGHSGGDGAFNGTSNSFLVWQDDVGRRHCQCIAGSDNRECVDSSSAHGNRLCSIVG